MARVAPDTPGGAHGVPSALTTFVGRAVEVAEVAGLLERSQLVTVTGPGGVGKTRLAGEVARRAAGRFAGGAWLVELAGVTDATQMPTAVAVSLGLQLAPGRRWRNRWPRCWRGSSCCSCWITAGTCWPRWPGGQGRPFRAGLAAGAGVAAADLAAETQQRMREAAQLGTQRSAQLGTQRSAQRQPGQ